MAFETWRSSKARINDCIVILYKACRSCACTGKCHACSNVKLASGCTSRNAVEDDLIIPWLELLARNIFCPALKSVH